jgi:two-component system phosphate regulon response regulator PhoB
MAVKKVIFILEDDLAIGEIADIILSDAGYDVKLCNSVLVLNQTLLLSTPDMFILDILLPDGNGLDVCSNLLLDALTSKIPILMMSATASKSEVEALGCFVGFIKKPFDIKDFVDRVNAAA